MPPKPDRPPPPQVADHDAVGVSLADRDLVDPDHLGSRRPRPAQLLPHVLHLQVLDHPPIQVRFLGHVLDGRDSATPSHEEGKAFAVERIVREPIQLLPLHLAASLAVDAPALDLQVDPMVSTGQVAHSAQLAVVPSSLEVATGSADRFFPRRCRQITRAFGSPKMPCTVEFGRKLGKRYVSHRRRCFRMRKSCQIS